MFRGVYTDIKSFQKSSDDHPWWNSWPFLSVSVYLKHTLVGSTQVLFGRFVVAKSMRCSVSGNFPRKIQRFHMVSICFNAFLQRLNFMKPHIYPNPMPIYPIDGWDAQLSRTSCQTSMERTRRSQGALKEADGADSPCVKLRGLSKPESPC